ncbi:28S ribosomal protein S25, mitochondrial-like [Hydractinia symbiolongicarpus]|uniref:28S ribosomal protein S25, mitochondrial-like n=1 Tax=Hydractinia symbiolongicarpus TaxID=13093 RepID=UPI00254CBE7F|nr:28S ribosomal protein S25, mitochondrial-like [Hydractinia symbiolongicarpus]
MASRFRRTLAKIIVTATRSSSSVTPVSRPSSINHCSKLYERRNFETEDRVLIIQKTLQHLKSNTTKLDKRIIANISINDRFESKGTDGASLFLYERIPQLKYNNPDVEITCTRDSTRPWEINVTLVNGNTIPLSVSGKSSNQILSEIDEINSAEIT